MKRIIGSIQQRKTGDINDDAFYVQQGTQSYRGTAGRDVTGVSDDFPGSTTKWAESPQESVAINAFEISALTESFVL